MIKPFYELAILGSVPSDISKQILEELAVRLKEFDFTVNDEVAVYIGAPSGFRPTGERCAAAVCFKVEATDEQSVLKLMERGIAIIPVASNDKAFNTEFPPSIATLNGLSLNKVNTSDVVTSLLECASLLPRQRRVFLSYRRDESTEAALQLYAALSGRLFDVFLDTHDIHPGQHFQEVLWQRLCDCDVLLFLDTEKYFESRWTEAEFGRANWRCIPLLRAAWPRVVLNDRAQLATSVDLQTDDFVGSSGHLTEDAVKRICNAVEDARTRSVATRFQQLMSTLRASIDRVKGRIEGLSLKRSLIVKTANGKRIGVYPSLGVPTSYTMFDATRDDHAPPVAVVYDDGGVDEQDWQEHMAWISQYVKDAVRLVSSYKAGWDFSDWN